MQKSSKNPWGENAKTYQRLIIVFLRGWYPGSRCRLGVAGKNVPISAKYSPRKRSEIREGDVQTNLKYLQLGISLQATRSCFDCGDLEEIQFSKKLLKRHTHTHTHTTPHTQAHNHKHKHTKAHKHKNCSWEEGTFSTRARLREAAQCSKTSHLACVWCVALWCTVCMHVFVLVFLFVCLFVCSVRIVLHNLPNVTVPGSKVVSAELKNFRFLQ